MGNPATDWEGHRHFVIGVLPSLEELDGKAITRTERIQSKQEMPTLIKQVAKPRAKIETTKSFEIK